MNRKKKLFSIFIITFLFVTIVANCFNNGSFAAKGNPNDVTTTGENLIYDDPKYIAERNNNLSKLEVVGYELNPTFNKNTTTYYLTIPNNITKLDVNCETEESTSTYKIVGNSKLSTSKESTITITVTSAKKTTKTYKIIVSREGDRKLKLSKLSIKDVTLSPEFDSDTFNYTAEVTTSELSKLDITAEANSGSAEIEIVGNEADEFQFGDNIISIILKGSNEVTTYQINVKFVKKNFTTITTDTTSGFVKWIINTWDDIKTFFSKQDNQIIVLSIIAIFLFILVIILGIKITGKKKGRKDSND